MPRTDRSLHEFVKREAQSTGQLKRSCEKCGGWIMDRSRSKFCAEHRRTRVHGGNGAKKKYRAGTTSVLFDVVGVTNGGRNVYEIAMEVEALANDLLHATGNERDGASVAESIMHLCADIIAIERSK